VYQSFPLSRARLLKHVYNKFKLTHGDRIAYFWLKKADLSRTGAETNDTEGLIDHIRAIEPVVVACVFEEVEPELTRISLRSKDKRVNVSEICGQFGGGGHPAAAGARIAGRPCPSNAVWWPPSRRRSTPRNNFPCKTSPRSTARFSLINPPACTSHDVVDAIRRKFGIKKVGHCGTLDPNATGLLIIVLGRGTKLSERLMGDDKVYEGTMKFGESHRQLRLRWRNHGLRCP
jgi:hypothetical protein